MIPQDKKIIHLPYYDHTHKTIFHTELILRNQIPFYKNKST